MNLLEKRETDIHQEDCPQGEIMIVNLLEELVTLLEEIEIDYLQGGTVRDNLPWWTGKEAL